MSDSERLCLYCLANRPVHQFSKEHIWPKALGGGLLANNFFQTKSVCRDCNSKCGRTVDARFVRSWIIQNEIQSSAHSFLDPRKPAIAPLIFAGRQTYREVPNEVCDHWLGMAGEQIYHFRPQEHVYLEPVVGGDPIAARKDESFAYMYLSSHEPYWVITALESFKKKFQNAKRALLTTIGGDHNIPSNLIPRIDDGSEIQKAHKSLIDKIKDEKISVSVSIDLDFDFPFLSKIAIGIGAALLGKKFINSARHRNLVEALWSRPPRDFSRYNFRHVPLWNEGFSLEPALRPFAIDGAWCVILTTAGGLLSAWFVTPTGRVASIEIWEKLEPCLSPVFDRTSGYMFFVCIPQLSRGWGPLTAEDMAKHFSGNRRCEALDEIESKRVELSDLPAKRNGTQAGEAGFSQ